MWVSLFERSAPSSRGAGASAPLQEHRSGVASSNADRSGREKKRRLSGKHFHSRFWTQPLLCETRRRLPVSLPPPPRPPSARPDGVLRKSKGMKPIIKKRIPLNLKVRGLQSHISVFEFPAGGEIVCPGL